MESNFVFIRIVNNQFEFKESSSGQVYVLPSLIGSTEADVHLREGGLVLLPSGNGGYFDLWNIREHRCIKSNVRPEDPIFSS